MALVVYVTVWFNVPPPPDGILPLLVESAGLADKCEELEIEIERAKEWVHSIAADALRSMTLAYAEAGIQDFARRRGNE